ncbi:conserved domain protein [Actinomyces sp. oral taxon 170 str. F0386]|nr:conserved domain protein [Actinomyces sp. oral taxon 170 str. F0386]
MPPYNGKGNRPDNQSRRRSRRRTWTKPIEKVPSHRGMRVPADD